MMKKKAVIELDTDNFTNLQKTKGWNESKTAVNIGVSPEQLWKVKKGKHNPGQDFIAGVLSAFPDVSFGYLFILPESLRERKIIRM